MNEQMRTLTASWQPGGRIDVYAAMQEFTLRVLIATIFSAPLATPFLADIQRCIPILLRGGYWRSVNPIDFLERLPLPANRRYDSALNTMRTIVATIVGEYRRRGSDHGDLLSMLVAARDETTGVGLTDEEVNDHVFTLLIAGSETTASLLAWVFHILGHNTDARQRLYAEIDALPSGASVDMTSLTNLDFTRRVLTETLRLYPPGWLLTRITTRDCVLGDYRIPQGTTLLYSPYLLHHRADVFPEPELFDPDRWLPERAAAVPRGAFVPFGGGSRKCIGDTFGMVEATIALVAIARDWAFEPAGTAPVRPVPRIALAPERLPVTLHPRHAQSSVDPVSAA
jgi:pentalenene oxygenase